MRRSVRGTCEADRPRRENTATRGVGPCGSSTSCHAHVRGSCAAAFCVLAAALRQDSLTSRIRLRHAPTQTAGGPLTSGAPYTRTGQPLRVPATATRAPAAHVPGSHQARRAELATSTSRKARAAAPRIPNVFRARGSEQHHISLGAPEGPAWALLAYSGEARGHRDEHSRLARGGAPRALCGRARYLGSRVRACGPARGCAWTSADRSLSQACACGDSLRMRKIPWCTACRLFERSRACERGEVGPEASRARVTGALRWPRLRGEGASLFEGAVAARGDIKLSEAPGRGVHMLVRWATMRSVSVVPPPLRCGCQ